MGKKKSDTGQEKNIVRKIRNDGFDYCEDIEGAIPCKQDFDTVMDNAPPPPPKKEK